MILNFVSKIYVDVLCFIHFIHISLFYYIITNVYFCFSRVFSKQTRIAVRSQGSINLVYKSRNDGKKWGHAKFVDNNYNAPGERNYAIAGSLKHRRWPKIKIISEHNCRIVIHDIIIYISTLCL